MSDMEYTQTKEQFDNLPFEPYNGLDYPTHRFANFIPVADSADQFTLRESITAIGLVEPIVLFEGKILDGRHRYKACTIVGVEPKFIEFEGDEEAALAFVLAKNVARRNLTTMQKLRLREQLVPEIERLKAKAKENLRLGGEGCSPVNKVDVLGESAKLVEVGRTTAYQYDKIKEAAEAPDAPEFIQQMLARAQAGEVSVKKAYTDVSAELDKEAKAQAKLLDPKRLQADALKAVAKAWALLENIDPSVVMGSDDENLVALADWIVDAGF